MNLSLPARLISALVLSAVICLHLQAAVADEARLKGPPKTIRTSGQANGPETGKAAILEEIFSAPVHFYQHFLSHQWGRSCAYYPSCSNYALSAIRRHGALVGSMLAFDRLQHEADEARTSPRILTGGQIKFFDPLENNDYWWYTTGDSKPVPPAKTSGMRKPCGKVSPPPQVTEAH